MRKNPMATRNGPSAGPGARTPGRSAWLFGVGAVAAALLLSACTSGGGEGRPDVLTREPVVPAVADGPAETPAGTVAEYATDIQSLVIDVGAVSKEDAVENFGIRIGEPVVPDVSFTYDEQHDIMMGKGFDCRIGCAALIETMRRLAEEELAVDLVGLFTLASGWYFLVSSRYAFFISSSDALGDTPSTS